MSEQRPSILETCPECNITRRKVVHGAAALAAGLAVSGKVAAQDASPVASPVGSGEQWDPNTVQPQGEFPIAPDGATLRVMIPSRSTVEDFATNEFTAWLEERTGVKVEWEVLPLDADGSANSALNVRMASGDYTDVILDFGGGRESLLQLYGSQGVFIPLNELIEEHGVYSKAMFEQNPAVRQIVTAADGNIYSMPDVNDCFHCSMFYKNWINAQWLENLGLEMPTTTEEFREVLKAFKEQDPNGNGQADEMGQTGSTLLWGGTIEPFFSGSFLFNPGGSLRLFVDEGTVKPVYTQDAWKESIKYLATLHADGLLDAEIFTRDRDQARTIGDGNGGPDPVIGAVCAGWWGEFTTQGGDPEGTWTQYVAMPPLEGPEGVRYSSFNPFGAATSGAAVITDNCADPVLAFKWLDALYELETTTRSVHGVKDRDWKWADIGTTGINGEQAWWQSITNIADLPIQNIHWEQAGPQNRTSTYRLSQYVPEEEQANNVEIILYNQTKENYEPYAQPAEMALPRLYLTEENASFVAELMPTLAAHVDQFYAQGVIGQIDVDAAWEEFKATADAMGLEQFVAIHQEAFDGANAS